ncbi:DNA primase [Ekhidna sp.]
MINPSTIEEIKNRIDIVEVVEDFVSLKRSGSSYKALSPFANEKTPSFYVVPSKGIFKDFSSGKGGDAITFVMEVDGLSYIEALRYLAGKYGIEVKEEEQSDEAMEAQNKRESLFIVLNYANEYFQEVLHHSEEGKSIGLSYFKERGFTDETIKKFELGYTKEIWDGLLNEATQKGYNKDLLSEAGLIIDKDGKTYDRFRSRVMFPIHNVSGKTIAFGGRKLSSTDKSAKYINSPETELYFKSKVLYGMYQSKNAVRKEDNCYLVEGYTDVISMHQAGIENVVASSGTALTEDQVKLIRRYSENVTVIFDGDQAGIKASMRGIDLLLEGDLNVKAVALPDGADPDSYAKELGAAGFREYVTEEAQDIIRFKTQVLLDETGNDPVKKAGVIKDIVSSITKINDPVKRTVYIKECSDLLGIAESVLIGEQNKILIQNRKNQRKEDFSEPPVEMPPFPMGQEELVDNLDIGRIIELQERESIRVLVNNRNRFLNSTVNKHLQEYYYDELEYDFQGIKFVNPIYQEIFEVVQKNKNYESLDTDFLLENVSEKARNVIIDLSTDRYELSDNWQGKYNIQIPTELQDLHLKDVCYTNILRWKFRLVQKMILDVLKELKKDEKSSNINEDAMNEIMDLKQIEVDIANRLGNVITR